MSEWRPAALRVTIAAATYRRPQDLAALLPLLEWQRRQAELDHHVEVDVVIVDNDPDGSGRAVVADHASPGTRCVIEPTPGIAAARNRALAECTDSDVIVFIDDDEQPVEQWLTSLLAIYLSETPTGVVGPVISEFEEPPSDWIVAGGFFDRLSHSTGTPVAVAATNNLLLDLADVRSLGLTFDPEFGLSGGSDTKFTRIISDSGRKLLWCAEAVVIDRVPPSRVTRDWVLRRARRSGNSHSRVDVALATHTPDRAVRRLRLTSQGTIRIAAGAFRQAFGAVRGDLVHQAKGARTLRRGLGMISGAWGRVVIEYGRG